MGKPFLILQLRPEDEAADSELEAFLQLGELSRENTRRLRMEKESLAEIDLNNYAAIIVGGGPSNVSDAEEVKSPAQLRFEGELVPLLDEVVERDFPFLGACYGLGALKMSGQ
jgi:GMP synthase (glutamine-hydrolysing)